jgi:hypothetical protein
MVIPKHLNFPIFLEGYITYAIWWWDMNIYFSSKVFTSRPTTLLMFNKAYIFFHNGMIF